MRVEILEDRLSDEDPVTGRHYLQHKGDLITVPEGLGVKWCELGWAKDLAKNVPTGVRHPGVHQVDAQPLSAKVK